MKLKSMISVVAGVLLAYHVFGPGLKPDGVTIALLAAGLLPWLVELVKVAEFPGGWKLEFHELKQLWHATIIGWRRPMPDPWKRW